MQTFHLQCRGLHRGSMEHSQGLQDLLVSRSDLKGLGNVPSTLPEDVDAPDGAHIQASDIPQVVVIEIGLQKKTQFLTIKLRDGVTSAFGGH